VALTGEDDHAGDASVKNCHSNITTGTVCCHLASVAE